MSKKNIMHQLIKGKSPIDKKQSELSRLERYTSSKLKKLKSGELSHEEMAYLKSIKQAIEANDYSKRLDIDKKYKDKIKIIRDAKRAKLKEKRFIQITEIYDIQLKKEGMAVSKLYANFLKLIEDLQSQRIKELKQRNKKYSNESYSNLKKDKTFKQFILEKFKEHLLENTTRKEINAITLKEIKQNLAKSFRDTYADIALESFGVVTKSDYKAGYKLESIKELDLSHKPRLAPEEIGSLFYR